NNQYKNRPSKYPLIERAMNIWVGQVLAAGLILTDKLVKTKGCEFRRLLGMSKNKLKFSNSHSKKLRSFNDINLSQLLVTYKNNEWFINSGFCIQNRKILLLADNAPSHSSPEVPNNTNEENSINNVDDSNLLIFDNRANEEQEPHRSACRSACRGAHRGACGGACRSGSARE
ncbi:13318_t:CDS:2, partial [Gigaspora margarita]